MPLPTGTVTFLFSDVEGSTQLLNAHPDDYRRAIRRHHELLQRAVEAHGGVVFETVGDAVYAAFARPTDGVAAALDGQRALHAEAWGETPIKVRMGLHLGEVELQGEHYFGAPLYRSGRLMAAAHGGQVVLSQAVGDLVRDALPEGAALVDLGEQRLRDMTRPERIYQLGAPGLPSEFPPLRTLDALPNNLPIQATPFVGRERQVEALSARLRQPEVRLLTLTGPGGTGKTRLALHVAAELLEQFADGVYFVQLAAFTAADFVTSAIAQALGVKEVAGRPPLESLKDALRPRRLLLVLDNFEQLLTAPAGEAAGSDAATLVTALLAAAPHLKVLATSRAPLRLYGEHEAPVPPLALPDQRAAPTAAHITQFEAVRLLVERAQAARPDFAVTDENAPLVAEICHRLDGLPLTIELAAARLRALPPRALLDRLEHRLPLLTGGARDLPARQQTLRNAIAWSYDLLSSEEQMLFRRLGVFHGCTLEAATEVCAGAAPQPGSASVALAPLAIDALDGVTSLAEKSLLRQEETEDGQPWYVMLETVREFALERSAESGEDAPVRRRHALYYLRLVESMDANIQGASQLQLLRRFEQEHDNLREALNWCQAQGYAEPAFRIAVALWWFWYVRGHASEGRARLSALLARFPEETTTRSRGLLRARALVAAGRLALFQGDLAESRRYLEPALRILEQLGDNAGMYATLQTLGLVADHQGDYAAAVHFLERSIEAARQIGDQSAAANALVNLGNVLLDNDDSARAQEALTEALALFEAVGELRGVGNACGALAVAALEAGDREEARRYAQRRVDVYTQAEDVRGRAVALVTLASVEAERGDFAAAHRLLVESLRAHQEAGDRSGVAVALDSFAILAAREGHATAALRFAGAAAALRETLGEFVPPKTQSQLDHKLAPARLAAGEAAAEAMAAGRALTLEQAIGEALALGLGEPPAIAPANGTSAKGTAANSSPAPGPPANGVLTPREQQVAALIARGYTNKQIAQELVITEGTAASHVVHILEKLGFSSRAQIAVWAAAQAGRRE